MKKIVSLLLAAGVFSSAFAQSSTTDEAKRIIFGEPRETRRTGDAKDIITGDDDRGVYSERTTRYPSSRSARIDRINREYEAKVQSIRNNRRLSAAEKERMIRILNDERRRKVRAIEGDYRRDDDRQYAGKHHRKHKFKNHPGKHKGWYKGKGNPHRDRD